MKHERLIKDAFTTISREADDAGTNYELSQASAKRAAKTIRELLEAIEKLTENDDDEYRY